MRARPRPRPPRRRGSAARRRGHSPAVRREIRSAPIWPPSAVSGATRVWRRPKTLRARRAIRSATAASASLDRSGRAGAPGPAGGPARGDRSGAGAPAGSAIVTSRGLARRSPAGPAAAIATAGTSAATGTATGSRSVSASGGSSRSVIGKSVEEVEPPRPGVDEHRLEDPGVGPATDDHDVVGAGAGAQLLDDRPDDRVRRDRAGEALQDPGEALGLRAAAVLELLDGEPVADRGEARRSRSGR